MPAMRGAICTPDFHDRTRKLQERIDALKAELKATQRDATRQAQLGKQSAALREKLHTGDTSRPGKKQPYQYNEATRHAELERNRLKQQVDELIAKGDRMNQSAGKKILGMVHNLQMGALLASIHVFKKLGYAVGGGHAMSLAADVSRSIAKHVIPGVKSVAEKSSQYGTGLDLDALKARFQGVKEAPKEALNQLKHGSASRELLGGIGRASDEYFTFAGTLSDALHTPGLLNRASETVRALSGYVGRTHAAEKEFLAQPEYREGLVRENKFMVKQLEAQGKTPEQIAEFMGRESTQAAAGVKALERAYESKMQGKNPVNAAFDAWVGTLDRSNNLGANFAGFLFKTIFPVRKIGVNVVKQGSSLAFGGIKAAVAAMSKEGITPERADYIMKNIGQQGAGASALAIGILYYNKFGGVPGVFSKREQPQNKDSEGKPIRAGEGDGFGSEAFHGAPLAMLQVGASMAQVFHKEFGEKGTDLALDVVLKPSLNWFLRTVPYTDQARRMINTAEFGRGRKGGIPSALGEIAGNTARGMVVPGALQQYAAATDPSHYYRQPRNFVEDIKTGIPGLREQVPTGRERRPDK